VTGVEEEAGPWSGGPRSWLHLVVGRRLVAAGVWDADARAFAAHRVHAELAAVEAAGGRTPDVEEVYAHLATSPYLRDADRARAEEEAIGRTLASGSGAQPCSAPNRYESLLERYAAPTNGVAPLLADASRFVRSLNRTEGRAGRLVGVAAGVAAPALVGFVAWTLESARRAGCARLAYVSRDGQILHAIASRLEAHRPAGDRLELVYTHGGRRVWHPAGLTPDVLGAEAPGWWIGEGMPAGAPPAPLEMLALDERDVPEGVAASVREVRRRPVAEQPAQLRALWARADVQVALGDLSRERRRLLCAYLARSGLGEGRWAMVDVGWRGRSAVSLNRALGAEGMTEPLNLYFGLIKPDAEMTRTGDWAPYLFCRPGPDREAGDLGGGLPSFIEVICSADHGPVRGFREGLDGVEPVMDPYDTAPDEWGMREVQSVILAVTDRVAPFVADLAEADLRPALIDLLRLFLHRPDRAEVEAWGPFPFAPDPGGAAAAPWVARWSTADMLRWAAQGRQPHSFWPQASRLLAPRAGRSLVELRKRVGAGRPR